MVNPRFLKKAKEWKSDTPPVQRIRTERPTPGDVFARGSFENHKEFYGKNSHKMPELIAEGRIPMSVYDLLTKRTQVLNTSGIEANEKAYWMNKYFDTGDGVLYLPEGVRGLKVVYDAQALKEMNSQSQLHNGALSLDGVDIQSLQGVGFSKQDLEKMSIGTHLTLEQAKNHPLWIALARDDKALLKEYAEAFFKHAKEAHSYDVNMGFRLGSAGDKPKMRAWCVDGAGNRSNAGGDYDLVNDDGRLVGLASETQKKK